MVFENITRKAEFDRITLGYERCDFQKLHFKIEPRREDMIYNKVNVKKNSDNLLNSETSNFYNLTSYICWTSTGGEENEKSVYQWNSNQEYVENDFRTENVYFYSLASPNCVPREKNCYCDELCFLDRHKDCCLQCWKPVKLDCDFHTTITERFRHCLWEGSRVAGERRFIEY